jgi:hypothetical protein
LVKKDLKTIEEEYLSAGKGYNDVVEVPLSEMRFEDLGKGTSYN